MIGHQDEQKSAPPIAALAANGTFVGIDRVGLESLASDDHRADMVAELISGGHREQDVPVAGLRLQLRRPQRCPSRCRPA
jgi:predicted metal-dependent phosphotriesterase family hydrolase